VALIKVQAIIKSFFPEVFGEEGWDERVCYNMFAKFL
jgi:hypothetical protein